MTYTEAIKCTYDQLGVKCNDDSYPEAAIRERVIAASLLIGTAVGPVVATETGNMIVEYGSAINEIPLQSPRIGGIIENQVVINGFNLRHGSQATINSLVHGYRKPSIYHWDVRKPKILQFAPAMQKSFSYSIEYIEKITRPKDDSEAIWDGEFEDGHYLICLHAALQTSLLTDETQALYAPLRQTFTDELQIFVTNHSHLSTAEQLLYQWTNHEVGK